VSSCHSDSAASRGRRESALARRQELGDVLLGRIAGRTTATEITLFESLGLAVEDLAASRLVYDRAVAQNAGVVVPFG
jgi:ornithine cyclodeaminase/alanine dehydrogenase-like protein (mu-crystallin family)